MSGKKRQTTKRNSRHGEALRALVTPAAGKRVALKIQRALSFDLLKPPYNKRTKKDLQCATRGHCYVATEAAYHLFGRSAGFVPYVRNHGRGRGTHWWLVNEDTGEILDPTAPQLLGDTTIYKKGRRQNFQQPTPSARARELMRRVRLASA